MGYCVSLDGGGSKVRIIVFDDEYRLVAHGISASVNPNVCSKDDIRRNLALCFDTVFADIAPKELEYAFLCIAGSLGELIDILESFVSIKNLVGISEGDMEMRANGLAANVLTVIAGTGVNISSFKDGRSGAYASGWGALVHDAGSGFSIGKMGLQAAIADYEHYGPHTALTKRIAEHFGINVDNFNDLGPLLYEKPSTVAQIAALTPLVVDCAEKGDLEAIRVLDENIRSLYLQLDGYLKRFPACETFTLVTGGGVWKNQRITEAFRCLVNKNHPSIKIVNPIFEPVVGGVFAYLRAKNIPFSQKISEQLQNEFAIVKPEKEN